MLKWNDTHNFKWGRNAFAYLDQGYVQANWYNISIAEVIAGARRKVIADYEKAIKSLTRVGTGGINGWKGKIGYKTPRYRHQCSKWLPHFLFSCFFISYIG